MMRHVASVIAGNSTLSVDLIYLQGDVKQREKIQLQQQLRRQVSLV